MASGPDSADVNTSGCPPPGGSGICWAERRKLPPAVAPAEPKEHHAAWTRFPVPKLE